MSLYTRDQNLSHYSSEVGVQNHAEVWGYSPYTLTHCVTRAVQSEFNDLQQLRFIRSLKTREDLTETKSYQAMS